MRLPTPAEKVQAILDAVPALAAYLQSIGKIDALGAFTRDEVCGMIRACQEAVQESLHRQTRSAFDDEQIPF